MDTGQSACGYSGIVRRAPMVIYHPAMSRALKVFWVASSVALSGVAVASGAHADPPPPPGTLCSFTLSPPQVVQVSGKDMVTATLTPDGCAGAFRPYLSVVCVQGGSTPNTCTQARETDTAQVYAPYQPGATYTSSGRGLGTSVQRHGRTELAAGGPAHRSALERQADSTVGTAKGAQLCEIASE